MRVIDLNITQGIHGFQAGKTTYSRNTNGSIVVRLRLERSSFKCPGCGLSEGVNAYSERVREITGLPIGRSRLILQVTIHRLYCQSCRRTYYESIPFLSSSKSRVTRQMERTIIELRREMSIKALADHFGLSWRTVKEIEKRSLGKRYAKVSLKNVRRIGIDEIYVFRRAKSDEKYITIVRDLDTGAVLEVARGKGAKALDRFARRIRRYCRKIELVCMDMSNAYSSWVVKNLRRATIVYDHFHVIKSMNDRLDKVRRRVSKEMDENTRKAIKGNRKLLLRNAENLDEDEKTAVNAIRDLCQPIADAYMLKERLRSIYASAEDMLDAGVMLDQWCELAVATKIPEMKTMAKTIRSHLTGILAFWSYDRATNASMEGFNNKVRWLISQAYGYRDYEYFRLKIHDLPSTQTRRAL